MELGGQSSACGHGWVGCAGLGQAQVSGEAQETTQAGLGFGTAGSRAGAGLLP